MEGVAMFDRIISIDWSGAGSEAEGVDLRIAIFDSTTDECSIVNRKRGRQEFHSWSRMACREWLLERLSEDVPTLVAMDFGFGMPWNTDSAVFGVDGWRKMVGSIGERYRQNGTARATAQAINDDERFEGHGPYRFDENRSDFRFYLDHGVPYFRLTELMTPQAISQWYLGSGGTVGFHTITGLAAIDHLLSLRDAGEIDFIVWPQETFLPDGQKHVLVESYPSICPKLDDYGPCRDSHQEDAWKVLQRLVAARSDGSLPSLFTIDEQSFGRIDGSGFQEQIQFEGFIFGLR
jgi:hypothetical protein